MTTTELSQEQPKSTDYLTINGLIGILGIRENELPDFLLQELFDNALDWIDSHAKEFVKLNKKPYIKLVTSKEENGNVTKITVRNSNLGKYEEILTKDQIDRIFDFDNFFSSKRNQYRIKRGARGGAFKEILGIPYALAVEDSNNDDILDYDDWKYPLQINVSNKRLIEVRVEIIDKIKKIPKPKIIEFKTNNNNNNSKEEDSDYTEISVYIPTKNYNLGRYYLIFKEYALANTYIDFEANFADYTKLSYPSTQDIKNWSNKTSAYFYSLNDFEKLIHGYSSINDSLNVFDNLIHKDFREGHIILDKKGIEFETLTFGELKQDNSKIEKIYRFLKDNLHSIGQRRSTSKSRDIELPFDLNKKIREDALCERFRQTFTDKDIEGYAYRLIPGYFGPEPEQKHPEEYPFIVEVFLVESRSKYNHDYDDDEDEEEDEDEDDEGHGNEKKKLHLYQSVNFSPTMYTNSLDDENSYSKIFEFVPNHSTKNNNLILNQFELFDSIEYSYGIGDLLSKCGYDTDKNRHRRSIDYVFVNLISPRIAYIGGGKARLELKPFGSIGQELYNFLKSPKLKGKTKNSKDPIRLEVKDLIFRERVYKIEFEKIDVNSLEPWDQSHIFYTLRVILIAKGYENVDKSRQYITSMIKDVCWELGLEVRGKGYRRHELGINAAERAQLYFDGQVFGVTFGQLEELMKKGTDLLVIEKESIANALMDYANKMGVAILNTRGFLTEDAEDLAELARENRCNIATLTDWDSSGLVIASKLPETYRIGIDEKTLEKLELSKEKVEERVQQKKKNDKHLPKLRKLSQDQIPKPYSKEEWNRMIRYVEGTGPKNRKRIEINSVTSAIGYEKFWNYIKKELESIFPYRDYNRSIKIQEYVLPESFEVFKENVTRYISEFQLPIKEGWMERLRNGTHKGLLDVKLYEKIIENELRKFVDKNDEVEDKIKEEFKMSFDLPHDDYYYIGGIRET